MTTVVRETLGDSGGDDHDGVKAGEPELQAGTPAGVLEPTPSDETYRAVGVSVGARRTLGGVAFEGVMAERIMPRRFTLSPRDLGGVVLGPDRYY